MPQVNVTSPRLVTLDFRQTQGDPDYGSCLWATFTMDLDAYSLTVLSDCGNYAYKWVPTPKSESFLHLMGRVEPGYLLDKISSRNTIDAEATRDALEELLKDNGAYPETLDDPGQVDLSELDLACRQDTDRDVYEAVTDAFEDTPMEGTDPMDIWSRIEKDFPANAKKIAEIFGRHVAPLCAEMAANAKP